MAYRRSGLVLVAIIGLLGFLLLAVGAPPITGPWNMMLLLDAGWRIVSGQVPHTDFHSPLGPLTYLLVAAGMKLGAVSTSSVTCGLVLFLLFLAPFAWYVASARLPWTLSFLFVLFLAIFLLTPRPLGYGVREGTYGMVYNREGYLLLATLLICVFLSPRDSTRQSPRVEGMCAGALLALLLYCKITYFLTGGVLVSVAVALDLRPKQWFVAFASTFVAVCAAAFFAFHINLQSYLLDVAAAGHSQSPGMRRHLLATALAGNGTWIYLLAFCVGLCAWVERRGRSPRRTLRVLLVPASIIAGALLINVGNASQLGAADDPLYFITAIVFLELFRRRHDTQMASGSALRLVYGASLALLLPICCGTILARDLASYAYAIAWNIAKRPTFDVSRRLQSPRLGDFYVPQSTDHVTSYWLSREHPARINDGLELLRQHLRRGDRVTTLAYTNPFSFALGLAPARDGLLWWDLNLSFDRLHAPSPEDVLGEASIVMLPRTSDRREGCCFDAVDTQLALYGDYLRTRFREIASTDVWVLYRRAVD